MITFTKLIYDDIALIVQKSCQNTFGTNSVVIDESKINEEELALIIRFLQQEGYIKL